MADLVKRFAKKVGKLLDEHTPFLGASAYSSKPVRIDDLDYVTICLNAQSYTYMLMYGMKNDAPYVFEIRVSDKMTHGGKIRVVNQFTIVDFDKDLEKMFEEFVWVPEVMVIQFRMEAVALREKVKKLTKK